MQDLMLDLETLDTRTSAIVLSIGAVVFDPHSDGMLGRFEVEFSDDLESQQEVGRTISSRTVAWWMKQSADAKRVFRPDPDPFIRVPTKEGLEMLFQFCRDYGIERVWGNGSDFDNATLKSLYESFDMVAPWLHHGNRCYRTVKASRPDVLEYPREGVFHNALDDAVHQAKHLQRINATEL